MRLRVGDPEIDGDGVEEGDLRQLHAALAEIGARFEIEPVFARLHGDAGEEGRIAPAIGVGLRLHQQLFLAAGDFIKTQFDALAGTAMRGVEDMCRQLAHFNLVMKRIIVNTYITTHRYIQMAKRGAIWPYSQVLRTGNARAESFKVQAPAPRFVPSRKCA